MGSTWCQVTTGPSDSCYPFRRGNSQVCRTGALLIGVADVTSRAGFTATLTVQSGMWLRRAFGSAGTGCG